LREEILEAVKEDGTLEDPDNDKKLAEKMDKLSPSAKEEFVKLLAEKKPDGTEDAANKKLKAALANNPKMKKAHEGDDDKGPKPGDDDNKGPKPGGDDNKDPNQTTQSDDRSYWCWLGPLIALVVIALVTFFLMHGGGSSEPDEDDSENDDDSESSQSE
jgi:hypothetical protein